MSRRGTSSGFTLIELVIAVALLSGAFLSLLFLRTSAVDRAAQYNRERQIQRFAQEKLDEVLYALEDNMDGTFEEQNRPEWTWQIEVQSLTTEEPELYECIITVFYPDGVDTEPAEYTLSAWFFPDEESPLRQEVSGTVGEAQQ